MIRITIQIARHSPLARHLLWVLFAILFYQAGETATIWLLEPTAFQGNWQWFWLSPFPVLLPAFFLLQRFFGCNTGQRPLSNHHPPAVAKPQRIIYHNRPPGC